MDVLSEVLKIVKLEGALFFNGEFTAPWCFESPPAATMAAYFSHEHLIPFHLLTEGHAFVRLANGQRENLVAGDIVILPHGDIHFMGNGSPEKPVNALKTFARNLEQGLKLAQFGGGGEITRFVCGYLVCEPRLGEIFFQGLPSILKVHIPNEPTGQWLAQSIRSSVNDFGDSNAGSKLVLSKLSELLFIETLRRYINGLPPGETGWLAGVRDPALGQALALLHKEPAHPWTISALAHRTGLSRTRLAERFRHYFGAPPMAYLAQWRLKLGAQILQATESSVAEVAATVGYGSEAAFNRAFKRQYACPPAQFRRSQSNSQVKSTT